MLDIKILRNEFARVKEALQNRNEKINEIDTFSELDEKRRGLLQESEKLKNRRNEVSKEVAQLKKAGQDADQLIIEMREVGDKIKELDEAVKVLDEQIDNIPHESVPIGSKEEDNVPIRFYGNKPEFGFTPKTHYDVAENLNILDFEAAGKVAGSRFVFYKGIGAKLERALINFMLDLHTEDHGYQEIFPPFIVNRQSMTGTGQLPKFEDDAFKLQDTDYFLVPTAEVPVTNMHRDEILLTAPVFALRPALPAVTQGD